MLYKLHEPHIFAPLGNSDYFRSHGIYPKHTHCLDWWESCNVTVLLPTASPLDASVKAIFQLTCTPAQHLSGRGLFDRRKSLWASWALMELLRPEGLKRSGGMKVWFAGDTGYRAVKEGDEESETEVCPAFKEIGAKFDGFDLALIPIG